MIHNRGISIQKQIPLIFSTIVLIGISGCSSDDSDGTGYIQVYNASSNAPELFLTVAKDNDDDFEEIIHSGGIYAQSSGYLEYDTDTYDIELAWQDEDDLNDLEVVYQSQLRVSEDNIQFLVVAEEITTPNVLTFNIPIIDDDDDLDDDLFNMRFLNMHTWSEGINIYLSESDETFNEAVLIGQYNYSEMSDNMKFEQDNYVFYITSVGSDEVLFESDEISFPSTAQYVMIIRENSGSGSSPFLLDKVTSSSRVGEYPDADAESEFRVYNGIPTHELLPDYLGEFDLHINEIDDTAEVESLSLGGFSSPYLTDFGDYRVSLTKPATNEAIIENHLLTLNINSDKSVFFYLLEEDVDEDGDGDVDEDGDGYVDEIEVSVNSLVVDNYQTESIYDHHVNVINLIDEYNSVNVYFVRSDETIDTANYSLRAYYANPRSTILRNNTYDVLVIGEENNSEIVLSSSELILDEDSYNLYLILEEDASTPTGYSMKFENQKSKN